MHVCRTPCRNNTMKQERNGIPYSRIKRSGNRHQDRLKSQHFAFQQHTAARLFDLRQNSTNGFFLQVQNPD